MGWYVDSWHCKPNATCVFPRLTSANSLEIVDSRIVSIWVGFLVMRLPMRMYNCIWNIIRGRIYFSLVSLLYSGDCILDFPEESIFGYLLYPLLVDAVPSLSFKHSEVAMYLKFASSISLENIFYHTYKHKKPNLYWLKNNANTPDYKSHTSGGSSGCYWNEQEC